MIRIPEPERQQLIDRLSSPFGRAVLELDGVEVRFEVRPLKALQLCIVPFIGGVHKGSWYVNVPGREEEPEAVLARRVLRKRVRRLYPPAKLKAVNRSRRALGMKPISKSENDFLCWGLFLCPRQLVAQIEREFEGVLVLEHDHV